MLTNVEQMALAKAIKRSEEDAIRNTLSVGNHPVDVTVRVTGWLTVGENTEKRATSSLISEEFLILVLKKAGFMRKKAAEIISEVSSEILKDWTGTTEDRKRSKEIRSALVREWDPNGEIVSILDGIKASIPKITVRGSCAFKGQVTVVEKLVEEVSKAG